MSIGINASDSYSVESNGDVRKAALLELAFNTPAMVW